jgi:23S rRNA pseudouridine2605 synthase
MSEMRLQRYLSQAGVAARRKAEELITEGAVTVNGKVVTVLGTKIEPGVDRICVDGKAVYAKELLYVLLNKPKGCITSVADPEGRLTVMDYLYNLPVKVVPVGRLDFNSEGVLLLTNDGDLAARLQSPDYHVEKTYHVKVRGRLSDAHVEVLRRGVRIGSHTTTRPAQVDRLRSKSSHDWLVITLTEGKSRQIHRMLDALGHVMLKLQRVAFAGLTFHGLRVGDARELTQTEVNQLRVLVNLPKTTVARGKWAAKREQSELARRARIRQMAQRAPERDEESAPRAPGQRSFAGRPAAPSRDSGRRSERGGESRYHSRPGAGYERGSGGDRRGAGWRGAEQGSDRRGAEGRGAAGRPRGPEQGRDRRGAEQGRDMRGGEGRGAAGRRGQGTGSERRGAEGRGAAGRPRGPEQGRDRRGAEQGSDRRGAEQGRDKRGGEGRGAAGRPRGPEQGRDRRGAEQGSDMRGGEGRGAAGRRGPGTGSDRRGSDKRGAGQGRDKRGSGGAGQRGSSQGRSRPGASATAPAAARRRTTSPSAAKPPARGKAPVKAAVRKPGKGPGRR